MIVFFGDLLNYFMSFYQTYATYSHVFQFLVKYSSRRKPSWILNIFIWRMCTVLRLTRYISSLSWVRGTLFWGMLSPSMSEKPCKSSSSVSSFNICCLHWRDDCWGCEYTSWNTKHRTITSQNCGGSLLKDLVILHTYSRASHHSSDAYIFEVSGSTVIPVEVMRNFHFLYAFLKSSSLFLKNA